MNVNHKNILRLGGICSIPEMFSTCGAKILTAVAAQNWKIGAGFKGQSQE